MDKDPSEKLDYAVDWTAWLGSTETITTSTWAATPSGLTLSGQSVTGGKAIVWATGGTAGTVYTVTNHIITSQAREGERSLVIVVVDR